MTDKSKIEWTDATWNPTDGCEVCSSGCANCYAMRFAGRFAKKGQRYHGLVSIAKNKRAIWTGATRLNANALTKPLGWARPRKVFVNSMSDLFYEKFTNDEIAAVYGVMALASQHTFQVLTKRSKRRREWFKWLEDRVEKDAEGWAGRECSMDIHQARDACAAMYCWDRAKEVIKTTGAAIESSVWNSEWMDRAHLAVWPLPNVWEGVSVENQAAADERIPDLLHTPAAVRFLSLEPLIGPVNLVYHFADAACHEGPLWGIVGCESGPGARPCSVEWVRSLRDQFAEAEEPFFLKQMTYVPPLSPVIIGEGRFVGHGPGSKKKPGGVIGAPYLDGVQHLAFPEAR